MPEVSLSDEHDTSEAFCADSCGRPATDERLDGVDSVGNWHFDLVCIWHAEHPEEAA